MLKFEVVINEKSSEILCILGRWADLCKKNNINIPVHATVCYTRLHERLVESILIFGYMGDEYSSILGWRSDITGLAFEFTSSPVIFTKQAT